ncbi:unnamed protein product [Rotaria sp. Silwood1]|nr:unnamed protein product [Rotaria sp. Silwood1]CAF1552132.1 unnamed protein product [Rotaria sp. Silwood1]CAF1553444.1 unnamed protein product [Rotaria sp. Silwood1]CAF3688588.1 unnamed protein product [Rotaria sp. Silwood1]CAF3694605.1 unnamed protein product [Rotaria sp. Silwood1]
MPGRNQIRIDEILHRQAGKTVLAEYLYEEDVGFGRRRSYHIKVPRDEYERIARRTLRTVIPFDKWLKVLRPFMLGEEAADDIAEAFRILDTDYSNKIDIDELEAFMPVIVPRAPPKVLRQYIQKVDRNFDGKLNLAEFTDLVTRGIGRDIAFIGA